MHPFLVRLNSSGVPEEIPEAEWEAFILDTKYWGDSHAIEALTITLQINIIPIESFIPLIDTQIYTFPDSILLYKTTDHYELITALNQSCSIFYTGDFSRKLNGSKILPLFMIFLIFFQNFININIPEQRTNYFMYKAII